MYNGKQPKLITVSGGSSSGKTSFCEIIEKKLGRKNVCFISLDWFYKELPNGVNGTDWNWDSPDAFDIEYLISVIESLKKGISVWAPEHDFITYKRKNEAHYLDPAPIILLEGIYTLYYDSIRQLTSYSFFVDCDSDTAFARRVIRDKQERGYSFELTMERYSKFVKPAFQDNIKPTKKYADIIILNHGKEKIKNNKGVEVVIGFFLNVLI